MISRCTQLKYLDDRPVFEDERRRVTVWAEAFHASNGDNKVALEAERESPEPFETKTHEGRESSSLTGDTLGVGIQGSGLQGGGLPLMTAAQLAEKQAAEMMQAQLELINDRAPSGTDKLVSVLNISAVLGASHGFLHPHDAHFVPGSSGDFILVTWNPGRIGYFRRIVSTSDVATG